MGRRYGTFPILLIQWLQVIRELQREVKQLYVELNEKTEAVDSLKRQLEELRTTSSEPAAVAVKAHSTESTKDYMVGSEEWGLGDLWFQYEEELESMRRKLKESHREIDELRDVNGRLERNLEGARKIQVSFFSKGVRVS